ncbi:MAG: hypothetical protein JXR80_05145 [Deltaproteobacteria bacterium]|nr:hypothetical protein [Deltaproteobacteria bacterium]
MAIKDPADKILYLARPGQFLQSKDPQCQSCYWLKAERYSEKVIKAYMIVIDLVKNEQKVKKIALVGYSGGGVIAALLAARRDDILWLATVAANLDLQLYCSQHQITPLDDSLKPIDFTATLQKIPQFHFVGGRDQIVPPEIVQSYINAMPEKKFVTMITKKKFDHHCCWEKEWPQLLNWILKDNSPDF